MDLTLQQLLDVDIQSEIDSMFATHLDLGLAKKLSPLDLDDDPFDWSGTDICRCFDAQMCWHGMNGGSSSQFDLDQSSFHSVFVHPKNAIPSDSSIPSEGITVVEDDCIEVKIPEIEPEEECHIETEPISLEHSEFDICETFTNAQLTELQLDDQQLTELQLDDPQLTELQLDDLQLTELQFDVPQNLENELQTYMQPQQEQQQQQLASATELKINDKVYPKPTFSYPCLSALALKNSQTGKLLVTQIYGFILTHFPYFRTAPKGWKNSVRHNLSHNKTFQKVDATTSGCPNKRSNLWFINPAKAAKMDAELRKASIKHSQKIRESMCHPEQLDMLVCGEMKFGSGMDVDEDDILSEFLAFPSAKRRKTVDGEMDTLYVYEPAKQRKTSLTYLTMDAFAEE